MAVQGTESIVEARTSLSTLIFAAKSTAALRVAKRLEGLSRERGRRAFVKFRKKLKEVICADDGPYGDFVKGKFKDDKALAGAIVAAMLSGATLGIMIAVYLAILVIRVGLKTYCERT